MALPDEHGKHTISKENLMRSQVGSAEMTEARGEQNRVEKEILKNATNLKRESVWDGV